VRAIIFDIDHTIFAENELREGVADLLAILQRLGLKVGALSSDDHRALVRLDEAGIRHFFSGIVCSSHIDYPKAPGGVQRLLEHLGVESHEATLASHAHADILLAKEVGLAKVIGVTHGTANTKALREAGADHLVDDIPGVLDVLE
jgi:phosphoglycolate phosphatase-like HAD superfamily hydrolase